MRDNCPTTAKYPASLKKKKKKKAAVHKFVTWPTSPSSAKTTEYYSTHNPLLFLPVVPSATPYLLPYLLKWPSTATTDLTTFTATVNCNHYYYTHSVNI